MSRDRFLGNTSPLKAAAVVQTFDAEEAGSLFKWDASGPANRRSDFDTEPKDFVYLVVEPLPFTAFIKLSDASGDWSEGNKFAPEIDDQIREMLADAEAAAGTIGEAKDYVLVQRQIVETSAEQVANDRQQTNADRAATSSDRTQTNADRAVTSSDRTQTNADRAVTSSDRTQTNADRAFVDNARRSVESAVWTDSILRDDLPTTAEWQTYANNTRVEVVSGPNAGVYVKTGAAGGGLLTLKSKASAPAIEARLNVGNFERIRLSALSVHKTNLPLGTKGAIFAANGPVIFLIDANNNVVTRNVELDAKIAARLPGYVKVRTSALAVHKTGLPANIRAVSISTNGIVLGGSYEDARPYFSSTFFAAFAPATALATERQERLATEERLQQVLGAVADTVSGLAGALLDRGDYSASRAYLGGDIVTFNGVRYWTMRPVRDLAPPASPWLAYTPGMATTRKFTDAYVAVADSKALSRSYGVMNRPAVRFIKATYEINLITQAGQSIFAGVASFGHSSIYTGPSYGVAGVLMEGFAERCASARGLVWETTGAAVKNDDKTLRPLQGSRRNQNEDDGSPIVSDAVNNASNFANANIGESPGVMMAYEGRRYTNDHIHRAHTSTEQPWLLKNVAIGSTRVGMWEPGDTTYGYFARVQSSAQTTVDNNPGKTVAIISHNWGQGVSDMTITSTMAWKGSFGKYKAGVRAIEKDVTKQPLPAPILFYSENPSGAGFTIDAATYDAGTTYARGDIKYFNFENYYSLIDNNQGNTPGVSNAWALLLPKFELNSGQTYGAYEWGYLQDNRARLSVVANNTDDPAGASSNWITLPGSWTRTGLAVQQAQHEFALENRDAFICCAGGPISDRTSHYPINGSRRIGAYYARTYHHVVNLRRDWLHPHMVFAEYEGDEILIHMHAPEPPITFREAFVLNTPVMLKDKGFRVFDNFDDMSRIVLSEPPGVSAPEPIYDIRRGVKGLTVSLAGDLLIRIKAPRNFASPPLVTIGDPVQWGVTNVCDSDLSVSAASYGFVPCAAMSERENILSLVNKPYSLANFVPPHFIYAVPA